MVAESKSWLRASRHDCYNSLGARGQFPTPPFHSMEVVWDAEPPKGMQKP